MTFVILELFTFDKKKESTNKKDQLKYTLEPVSSIDGLKRVNIWSW